MFTKTTFPSIINTSQNPRWLEWFRDLHLTIATCVRSHLRGSNGDPEVTRTSHVASCSYGKSPYSSSTWHMFYSYLYVKLPEASLGKWETNTELPQSPSKHASWWATHTQCSIVQPHKFKVSYQRAMAMRTRERVCMPCMNGHLDCVSCFVSST